MEVAALAACLNTLLPRLWDHRKAKEKERIAIENEIEDIRTRIRRLDAVSEDAKFKGHGTGGSAAATELKRRARESIQQIHDSIQRFFIIEKNTDSTEFATKTKAHKENLQSICLELQKLSSEETVSEKPQDPFVADPMDMGEPKTELLELVKLPGSRPGVGMRKVISIVGFGGLGKTLLAKLIYDHDNPLLAQASSSTSTPPADCTLRARVTAAAKKPEEVLSEILKQLDAAGKHGNLNSVKAQADTTCKYENLKLDELGKSLAERLRNQRYFIVIDDMQGKETWNSMNDAFPMDRNEDGTIIVTTTIKSVADACSSRNGYVYKLSPLDEKKSLELFLKDREYWNLTKDKASNILKKCEGLPLAIVSMSQSLEGQRVLTSQLCADACKMLGANLVNEKGGLTRLRWVLMNNYTSLPGYNLRDCLLYFCMYKHNMGAVPKRNSLIRRWEAERFLVEGNMSRPTDVGAENLETLVDRNIIQTMEVDINGTARRCCRPPGMMLEYISQISMLENFAALVCDVETGEKPIRRLSFRADPNRGANEKKISKMDLRIVLTLAVSGDGCKAILTFKKYQLIAVLDLKECTNLEKSHVKDICELLLLKYLSLGDSIGEIPREVGKLVQLETLEMRRTKETVKVYREVLELPNLKHLLGNFMLREEADKELCTFLEKDSGLETVTGFVTKTTKGFPKLMNHMVRVTKLKIYCDAGNKNDDDIGEAIKKFIGRAMDSGGTSCSLSINLSNSMGEQWAPPLEFLQYSGSLNSLKLRGGWGTFQLPTIPATGEDSNNQQPKITVPATGEQSKRKAVPEQLTTIPDFKKLCISPTFKGGNGILAKPTVPASGEQSKPRLPITGITKLWLPSKRGKNILAKPTVPASGEQSKPRLLGPFTAITGITKLCLSHTSKRGKNILATLTHMSTLEYLKLEEENLGPLTIESCTFQSLVRLFLMGETTPQEGETSPQGITIQLKALPSLVSLHVISKAPIFRVEDQSYKGKGKQVISQSEDHQVQLPNGCLGCLQEIALHSGVQPDMHKAWKRAAKDHPNRPAVMQITPNA